MMRTAVTILLPLSLAVLASCATAPATVADSRASAASASAESRGQQATGPIVILVLNPSLSDAVLEAAKQRPLLHHARVNALPGAWTGRTIVMKFDSSVNRERQRKNLEGAVATGLSGMILGAMVPWACATTHVLSVKVLGADGVEVFSEAVTEKQDTVGTMLWCPDVTEPSTSVATKMASTVFVKLEQSGVLSIDEPR